MTKDELLILAASQIAGGIAQNAYGMEKSSVAQKAARAYLNSRFSIQSPTRLMQFKLRVSGM